MGEENRKKTYNLSGVIFGIFIPESPPLLSLITTDQFQIFLIFFRFSIFSSDALSDRRVCERRGDRKRDFRFFFTPYTICHHIGIIDSKILIIEKFVIFRERGERFT